MRINKYLADSGICSRRNADKLIEEGRVKFNGKIVRELGLDINTDNDTVMVDDKKVTPVAQFTYLIFNKPKGCITAVSDSRGRKTVMDYIDIEDKRLFPVGRLDYDSEGMLIITDDGDLAFRLTHPKNEIFKTYHVKIEGVINDTEIRSLRNGVMIDGYKTNRCSIRVLNIADNITRLEVKINEGRNHQIKKMFLTVGKTVIFLKRMAVGDLRLGGLSRGKYRYLKDEEIFYLKNL